MAQKKRGWVKREETAPSITREEVEPHAVFRKLYAPLGAIVVTFADLEAQVTVVLNTLLGTSYREGAALEWLMQNFSMRIELFYFLAMRATTVAAPEESASALEIKRIAARQALRKSANDIYTDLKQANSDRNNLLHGSWSGLSATDLTYSKMRLQVADGGLKEIPVRGISIALLKEEVDFIIALNIRLADWRGRLKRWDKPETWHPPSPNKYLLRSPLGRLMRAHRKAAERPPEASPQ